MASVSFWHFPEKRTHESAAVSIRRARRGWGANRDDEGVRATVRLPGGGEGLSLVRLSVDDPVLPVNFESDAPGGVKILAQQLLEQIQGAQGVDLAPLAALAAP